MNIEERNEFLFSRLEQTLRRMRPKQDMQALMKTLRERFVTPDALLSASPYVLELCGMHPHDALLISHIPEINRHMERAGYDKGYKLNHLENAARFLVSNFNGYQVERFYVLHLDIRGRLIENTLLHEGTADRSLFPLKKMLSEITRLSSKTVILSHNHPAGTLRPSQDDLHSTGIRIARAVSHRRSDARSYNRCGAKCRKPTPERVFAGFPLAGSGARKPYAEQLSPAAG